MRSMFRKPGSTGVANRRRAATGVFVVVMLPVLIGMAALTIDVGIMYNVRADLQHAADAAALAAVQELTNPDQDEGVEAAKAVADRYIGANPVLGRRVAERDDIEFGRATASGAGFVFGPNMEPYNAVRVTLRHRVSHTFAAALGHGGSTISAAAAAAVVPPYRVDMVPVALRTPGFGPVDPAVAAANPGKDGPSYPANGEAFQIGDIVTLFCFGQGPRSPVHLVLDLPDSPGVSLINDVLSGDSGPVGVSIGDELEVWNKGTGDGNFGVKLMDRLQDADEGNDTIVVPVVAAIAGSRDAKGELSGKVRIVDFAAVTLLEARDVEVPRPGKPGKTVTIKILVGEVVAVSAGRAAGAPPRRLYTQGSVTTPPALIE